ncbi:hypothetical protein [Massilia sp. MS-15]|uniref:hypothetical protein n=1 Tax=Massilia sp. MS-15 TaxID=2878200 RepID=UPI001CD7B092|nr:hypothetical protein [Massilia sp. MS-15]MCA1245330.1 hypothetical protein [Massilia sp. MS-15]
MRIELDAAENDSMPHWTHRPKGHAIQEHIMHTEPTPQQQQQQQQEQEQEQEQEPGQEQESQQRDQDKAERDNMTQNFDGLANKKPEELTPEELRLMADTMPGEGPGD